MDHLSKILNRLSISSGVFFSGQVCGFSDFGQSHSNEGHLHILQKGRLEISDLRGVRVLDEPTVLFYPTPSRHRLKAVRSDNAHVVCATIKYGSQADNLISNALPVCVSVALAECPALLEHAGYLFDEAFHERHGRGVMMDKMTEIILILLLRHVLETEKIATGFLAGLVHPQLGPLLMAIHEAPEAPWKLQTMADMVHMSRSKFAAEFQRIVGVSPGNYLLECRISLAQSLLKRGKPINLIANQVGYENTSALGKAFKKRVKLSPRAWMQSVAETT